MKGGLGRFLLPFPLTFSSEAYSERSQAEAVSVSKRIAAEVGFMLWA
jgi:hypothetical protein